MALDGSAFPLMWNLCLVSGDSNRSFLVMEDAEDLRKLRREPVLLRAIFVWCDTRQL